MPIVDMMYKIHFAHNAMHKVTKDTNLTVGPYFVKIYTCCILHEVSFVTSPVDRYLQGHSVRTFSVRGL